jgi:hypothetical protein
VKNLNRLQRSRVARRPRLAVPAAGIVVALAVVGTAAAHSRQAAAWTAKLRYSQKAQRIDRPRFRNHRLVIVGTEAGDSIGLRLRAGRGPRRVCCAQEVRELLRSGGGN